MSITLHAALADYPHVLALKDGSVGSDQTAFAWETVTPITRAFRRMVRTGDFDLCEIALTTLAQAKAFDKSLTGFPVVVMRGFHHAALMCRVGSPLRGPEDLAGKRIGVRAYSQTTGVWLRGILLDSYGVDHRSITWVTEEDAHLQEYRDPANVVRISPGQSLGTMLLSGEIDAAIALTGLDPASVRTVIPNADEAAADWYRQTGAYPVNHVVCIKTVLLQEHPSLGDELMRLFAAAKTAARGPSAEARFAPIVGPDPLPYGLEANRPSIELCLRYAAEQGLVQHVYTPEQLFLTGG
ncbi:MAG TPA: ABC transporter substrate-binding protein [Acetobacteraceae bacterium]|nr:ABC transporter substrate-binding protein [Acetobacteraceae bacterium]